MGERRNISRMSAPTCARLFYPLVALTSMLFFSSQGTIMATHEHQNHTTQVDSTGVRVTVVYDNNPMAAGLRTAWGFACVIETGQAKVLFDTGGDGALLLENMGRLGLAPADIDQVVLSHAHSDHTGGLSAILRAHPGLPVYVPRSFPRTLSEEITAAGGTPTPVGSFAEIRPGFFTLGEFGGAIPEQALAVRTPRGLVIVTGCAHPGIVTIISRAKEVFGKERLYLVIGGFHLGRASRDEILDIVKSFKELGIQTVAACHCTGDTARSIFSEAYGKNSLLIGVGGTIEIKGRQ
jgi:7,8-dihydropterin-6-yl-methyl-4-(beta-D-ribofuranosyl)aminobenzene 5'-phosphate synthase